MRFESYSIGVALLATGGALFAADTLEISLDAGYRQMYNLQFADAHKTFEQWGKLNPDAPLAPISDAAAYLFTELERMRILDTEFFLIDEKFFGDRARPDAALKRSFLGALDRGAALSARALSHDPSNAEVLFADLLSHGLRADYLSLVEKSNIPALRETIAGRNLAERLLMQKPDYYDAYVAIGVENYLLSLKPAPIRWFVRLGGARPDKDAGIAKLRLTAENGRYLMPFAKLLLAVAALRDGHREQARQYLRGLAAEFPLNRLVRQELNRLGP